MERKPVVSVIMPAYQGEKYIEEAISSVVNQTYDNWELIIVEDASKDNTLTRIKQFSDKRITVIEHEVNKGISYSINEAITFSKGDYVAFLDDDDIAFENRLELEVEFMKNNPDVDIVGGRVEIIDENGLVVSEWNVPRKNPHYIQAMLLFRFVDFSQGTWLIRKSFFDRTGIQMREGYLGMQDFQFMVEASKVGKITSIPDFLLKSREHDSNETFIQRTENSEARSKKYSQIQRDSLALSGFELSEEQLCLINSCVTELKKSCESFEQFIKLCAVFDEMIKQAEAKEMDFVEELKIFLNRELRDILIQMKHL